MKYQEFIILDVETTGVDSKQDDIIEFAAVKLDINGQIIDELEFLISTPQTLSSTIIALTGITQNDIADKPSMADSISRINEFCKDLPIVGHNIGFDIEFLIAKGCDVKSNPALDTLEMAYTVLPFQNFYRLEYLSKRFNFPNQPSHRAMADVLATADLFRLLVHQVIDLKTKTREQINKIIDKDTWQWQWLLAEPLNFGDERYQPSVDTTITDKLIEEIKLSDDYLQKIANKQTGKVNFIETHFPISALGLACAYATTQKPAVLVVPDKMIQQLDWRSIYSNLSYDAYRPAELTYRDNSEIEFVESGISIGALEARLITKLIIWKEEWSLTDKHLRPNKGRDYLKLYLTRDEEYQFAQKFSQLDVVVSSADIILTTPTNILDMDVSNREVVVFEPLMLEDAEFRIASRLFSLNYFNAAISSRRDFVHQYIKPVDVKMADSAFKILNHISSNLTKLSEIIIGIFRAYPPTSQWERNIELTEDVLSDEFKETVAGVLKNLVAYLELIKATTKPTTKQITSTEKLIDHLKALSVLSADYRYFLFADDSRFYLELVPSAPQFSSIRKLAQDARAFTVLSPGLSIAKNFDYWKKYFSEINTAIIDSEKTIELITADDADEDPIRALVSITRQLVLRGNEKSLVLASSNYEGKDVFDQIFNEARDANINFYSNDVAGTVTRIPKLLDDQPTIYIGSYMWMHQAVWYCDKFDRIVMGKVPFEAISRPQFKILGDGREGFNNYTLARTVFRFKAVLHAVSLLNKPISLVDARWYRKEYGRTIINSLVGFTVIEDQIDSLLD